MRMAADIIQMWAVTCFSVIVFTPVIASTDRDFHVFYGDKDITEDVNLQVQELDAPVPDFNGASLSSSLKGNSVGKPLYLNVSLYDYKINSIAYPGVTFDWGSPFSEASRRGLKGFYVEIDGENGSGLYRLYTVNISKHVQKEPNFRMDLKTFSGKGDDFIVKVYSMPANQEERNRTRSFEYYYLRMAHPKNNTYFYPNNWIPTVTYKPWLDDHDKCVDIHFSVPPKRDGQPSTKFNVTLLSCPEKKKVHKSLVTVTNDTEGYVQFKGLELSVNYSIVVEIIDYNKSLCICQTKSAECNVNCGLYQTKEFSLPSNGGLNELSSSNRCVYTRPFLPGTSDITTQKFANKESGKGVPTTVVVIIVTLVILIALAATAVFVRRRFKRGKDNDQPTDNDTLHDADIAKKPLEEKVKELQRKTVYIVAASDHVETENLIESFCGFLKAHCQCNVINPRDANLRQTHDESAWVASKMSDSDCIIFVNSSEAAKLLNVYLKSIEDDSDAPESMSCKALQFSFSSKLKSKKFITVTFNRDWIKDKLAVLNPKSYILPKQLPHLLCGIHNLSAREAENYKGQLPLDMNCLNNFLEWQLLHQSIKEIEQFENSNSYFETEDDDTSQKPSTGLSNGLWSVSMTNLHVALEDHKPSPANSAPSKLFKNPGNSSEKDPLKTTHPQFSNPPGELLDGMSFVTIGKESDVLNNVSQEASLLVYGDKQMTANSQPLPNATSKDNPNHGNDHEPGRDVGTEVDRQPESNQPCHERVLRLKANAHTPSPHIIPPRGNINPPCDDNMSQALANFNDNASMWSNQPGNGAVIRGESQGKAEKSNQTFLERKLRPEVNMPAPSPHVIPPRGNRNPPCDDSMSQALASFNDNLSVWSNQPGNGAIIQERTRGEAEKPNQTFPEKKLRLEANTPPPPPHLIPPRGNRNPPCDDSMSEALASFNDNLSVWSNQPVNGAIIQERTRGEAEKPKQTFPERKLRLEANTPPPPPHLVPPRGNINPPCDDSMSQVLASLNDNVSVWSNQHGNGAFDREESRGKVEKPTGLVNHNQSRTIKAPPAFLPCDNLSARPQALNEEDKAKCFQKQPSEFQEDNADEITV